MPYFGNLFKASKASRKTSLRSNSNIVRVPNEQDVTFVFPADVLALSQMTSQEAEAALDEAEVALARGLRLKMDACLDRCFLVLAS